MITKSDLNVCILGTGSEIDLKDLTEEVNKLDRETKKQIYFKVSKMFTRNKFKLFDELPLMHKEFSKMGKELKLHPAVIFYVNMEVLDGGKDKF